MEHQNPLIPIDELSSYLELTAKTRGDTLEEKFANFISRLRKVVHDSKDTKSSYRESFSKAHEETLKHLLKETELREIREVLEQTAVDFFGYVRMISMKYDDSDELFPGTVRAQAVGARDAYSILTLEISQIIGWI